ncbi:MAG: hypothetical protein Q7J31_04990, partial [Syntrophales bacterium]|nr:hypothetical protein [Syntrophales bacterium]
TLLGVTVWLMRTGKTRWAWVVTAAPMVFMYIMSAWSLLLIIGPWLLSFGQGFRFDMVAFVALILAVLAALMLLEALRTFRQRPSRTEKEAGNRGRP